MNQRSLVAALTILTVCLAGLPAPAVAQTFTFLGTGLRSCWEDTEGFTAAPDLQPIPLPAGDPPGTHFRRRSDLTTSSTVIINTNGTHTTSIISTIVRNTGTSIAVSTSTCSGPVTFDNGTQTLSVTNNCSFTNTIGGNSTGTLVTHTDYSLAGTTLVRREPSTPEVETVNVLTGTGAPFSYQRVCASTGSLHLQ